MDVLDSFPGVILGPLTINGTRIPPYIASHLPLLSGVLLPF